MSKTAVYHTTVIWQGQHWGRVALGNGPEMDFSAPPDAQGHEGVFTPEDAFVAAVNTCIMLMFVWAAKRYKLNLQDYVCRAEGTKVVALDRTEQFSEVRLWPQIRVAVSSEEPSRVLARVKKALAAAQKYSLVANSVTAAVVLEPAIEIVDLAQAGAAGG